MSDDMQRTNRLRNLVIFLVGLTALGLATAGTVLPLDFIGKTFPGFLVYHNNAVGINLISYWEGFHRGLETNDIVIKVNQQPVRSSDDLYQGQGEQ